MYKGKTYKDGQTFKDDCNDCKCDDGDAVCTQIECKSKVCCYYLCNLNFCYYNYYLYCCC
ncbi:hypothetical protein DPMN_077154 [Dreissena polymorpha]|uniref:Pacifastin domain-containing protein n=1 Tax=Dreissena polymorpha TaxID=45954 RepID=A0A9D3YJY6_DREPO|nr:hypothetical protein DPMN_077154 [Dreissena polymorpha]